MSFVAIVVLLGHWIDYFLMIKPGALINASHSQGHAEDHGGDAAHAVGHGAEHVSNFVAGFSMPGLLEIGTFIGFWDYLCMFH